MLGYLTLEEGLRAYAPIFQELIDDCVIRLDTDDHHTLEDGGGADEAPVFEE